FDDVAQCSDLHAFDSEELVEHAGSSRAYPDNPTRIIGRRSNFIPNTLSSGSGPISPSAVVDGVRRSASPSVAPAIAADLSRSRRDICEPLPFFIPVSPRIPMLFPVWRG